MIRLARKIWTPWFVVLVVIILVHQLLQKILKVPIPFIDSYLDPLLLMPLILHMILWEKRILFKKGLSYTFPFYHLILYFILVSFIGEFLFPKWNPGFTFDYWDIACYGIGTLLYELIGNKPYVKKKRDSR